MTTILATIVFILGVSIGSFLSVLIYRIESNSRAKKKQKIFLARSMCPHCKKNLKWRHLIPVLSFLVLRGKCAYCGEKISVHYFAIELMTGLLFLASFFNWNFLEIAPSVINADFLSYSINYTNLGLFIFYTIEFSFLTLIFFYDLLHQEIPDSFTIPAILIAIIGVVTFGIATIPSMILGGLSIGLFFLLQFLLSKGKWIGGGDIRLGLFMGILLGLGNGLIALIAAYIFGALISIFLLIGKKANRKTQIPFGPFLVIGIIVAIFYGNIILNWYLESLSI